MIDRERSIHTEEFNLMSNRLILPSLEIQRFRTFQKLKIERLGRVNLIVGKNNVGKTSLLEALYLYANPGNPEVLLDLISTRDEFDQPQVPKPNGRRPTPVPVEAIFHGRGATPDQASAISIGPIGVDHKTLYIEVRLKRSNKRAFDPGDYSTDIPSGDDDVDNDLLEGTPALSYRIGGQPPLLIPTDDSWKFSRYGRISSPRSDALASHTINLCYVKSSGLDPEWTRQAWSNINLTNHHENITNSLRIIEGKISQVSTNVSSIDKLVPIVRLEGSPEPITLRSMGDGMVHVFNLALALVNSKDGILLVDEIENGLHYSVLEDFWKFLIKSAQALDVQVFATTHSWDCVEAFQKAACEDRSSDGYLIRLGWRKDEIVATVYDENDLAIVTRDQIEVR
jgi:hypothetical protein